MDITPIINAAIALLAAIVTAFVVPWIKNKIGQQNMDTFLAWVEIAVAAAEQLYKDADGELKKKYVVAYLESKGFTVDSEDVDNAIEAAVLELHSALYGKGAAA